MSGRIRVVFEVLRSDLAARIGVLHTNHGRVQTPAYVPVIHPVRQTIPPEKIRRMGFEMVITNAYITRRHYGGRAVRRGIHRIIGFDGPVMTDSGGYQVLEYGDLDVTPEEMASFETGINTDIAIPLDKPTGFGLARNDARRFVEHTLRVSRDTIRDSEDNGQIWAGPIQGGEHFDLVRRSTRALIRDGFGMLALGSPVEFMESYQYALLAEMILAAKRSMPAGVPLHLFGAGHPLTIPFAVALGCDTFDSASYILYAKQDRYMTEDGTRRISDMGYFACSCEVCSAFTPGELASLDAPDRTDRIALHNLYAIKSEVDRTREAIHEGRLWEHVMKKMRAHPRLHDVADIFVRNAGYFAHTTPKFKDRAVFLFGTEDQFRPEVRNYHGMAREFASGKKILCITRDTQTRPAYLSPWYAAVRRRFRNPDLVQFCQYNPLLGVIPVEISDVYPASHYLASRARHAPEDCTEFAETWRAFLGRNGFERIYYDKRDEFLAHFARTVPRGVRRHDLKG